MKREAPARNKVIVSGGQVVLTGRSNLREGSDQKDVLFHDNGNSTAVLIVRPIGKSSCSGEQAAGLGGKPRVSTKARWFPVTTASFTSERMTVVNAGGHPFTNWRIRVSRVFFENSAEIRLSVPPDSYFIW